MELITYSFVLYLHHGRCDVKCEPSSIVVYLQGVKLQGTLGITREKYGRVMVDRTLQTHTTYKTNLEEIKRKLRGIELLERLD